MCRQITQYLHGAGDICMGMRDISLAKPRKLRRKTIKIGKPWHQLSTDQLEQLQQCSPVAASNVKSLPHRFVVAGNSRQQISLDDICNVTEVAAVRSITIDGGLRSLDHSGNPSRN